MVKLAFEVLEPLFEVAEVALGLGLSLDFGAGDGLTADELKADFVEDLGVGGFGFGLNLSGSVFEGCFHLQDEDLPTISFLIPIFSDVFTYSRITPWISRMSILSFTRLIVAVAPLKAPQISDWVCIVDSCIDMDFNCDSIM